MTRLGTPICPELVWYWRNSSSAATAPSFCEYCVRYSALSLSTSSTAGPFCARAVKVPPATTISDTNDVQRRTRVILAMAALPYTMRYHGPVTSPDAVDEAELLVFGPHPDDIEIGAGGTVARHADLGRRVGLCDLTA